MSTNKNKIGIIRRKAIVELATSVRRVNKRGGHLRNGGDDVGDGAGGGGGGGAGPESVGTGSVFIPDENNNQTGAA